MVKVRIHISLAALLTAMTALVCDVSGNAADTGTRIFDPRFRTLKTMAEENFMAPPVIRLGTNDRIVVNFDEIGEENSWLEFRLVHCDADWQPSRLLESEYIDGFNSQKIEDFAYSSATFVHYVNYQITLPNEDMEILHSGNYLLQVYDPDYPDEVLLQTRFQVSEGLAGVGGMVTTRTDLGHNDEWQQLSLAVGCEGLGNFNPYQDIIVDIVQDMRPQSRRRLMTPHSVQGREILYEHMPDLIFPAGNEYRRFESITTAYNGLHVDSMRYMGSNYHVWLTPDKPRVFSQYSYDRTQHGRYLVREYNASDSNLGADYITVHFTLEMPELQGREVYVDGEFTHGVCDDSTRMAYDSSLGAYTLQIPVKQGSYNYQYVTRPRGSGGPAVPAEIEGNKYETSNEYNVSVYFRPPGARADRLVGSATIQM